MATNTITSKQTISKASPITNKQQAEDEEEQSRDEWTPTPEVFASFLKRDAELASSNLALAMSGSAKFPMTLRDLKDCMLHSVDVIERTLTSYRAAGRIITDEKGRYSLVA
jgi:hypothetical protein